MDPLSPILTASADIAPAFYAAGGALVVLALAIALLGMRNESFPSTGAWRAIVGLVVLVVIATGTFAVLTAREEQDLRREELAAHEAEEEAEQPVEAPGEEPTGEEPPAEQPPAKGDPKLGAELFSEQGCGGCHTLADAGSTATIGPNLDEVLPGQQPDQILTSIVDPEAETTEGFPSGVMPDTFGDELTPEDLDALVAYLRQAAG